MTTVRNAKELADAIAKRVTEIEVEGSITGSPMITLPPGVNLRGGELVFGAKGVRLTSNNTLESIRIVTADDEVAILNDASVSDLGRVVLRGVRTVGQVLLVAEDQVRAGHVQIEGLHVERADVRGRARRPQGFGVEALQGGLTVWNLQPDPCVTISAEILDVSIGTEKTPVRGSGVFVGGHGDTSGHGDGGVLTVRRMRTGEIHIDGRIPPKTPDLIAGGVFVISGATVDEVVNAGPVTTYGQNDMVLDNWGKVTSWTATAPITSRGPSGIGFVNFGDIDRLDVRAPIATHGQGARGFNLYDGSLREATFASIATTGDGSIGIQISKPLGSLTVHGDVTTAGSRGTSLVKGVQVELVAAALSVKPGGKVDSISIGGALRTTGSDVTTVEIEGEIGRVSVTGGIHAEGKASNAVRVRGTVPGLEAITLAARDGHKLIRD